MNSEQEYMPVSNGRAEEISSIRAYLKSQEGRPWSSGQANAKARLKQLEREQAAERPRPQHSEARPWRRQGPAIIRSHQGRFEDFFEVIPEAELSASERASLAAQRQAVLDHKAALALNRGEPVYAEVQPYFEN